MSTPLSATGVSGPGRGVVWAAATALSYSSWAIVGRNLLDNLGIASMLLWRFGLASIVLWLILAVRRPVGGVRTTGVSPVVSLVLGAVFGALVFVGFLSLERLDVSVYVVVLYVYPVLVVVASSLLGHRVAPLTWLALALVMVGIVLTVPDLFSGVGSVDVTGLLLALGQAVMFAAFLTVNGRVIPEHADGVVTAAWTVLGAAIAMAPLVVWQGLAVPDSGRLVVEVALFALVPTVISNICFFRALRYVAPGIVAMVLTLEVALTILWSSLLLDERLRGVQYVGAGVVVMAVLLAQWVALRDARQRSVPGLETLGAAPVP